MFKLLPLVLIGFLLSAAQAQESLIEVDAQVDTTLISIGDRVTYDLRISYAPQIAVSIPDKISFGAFELKDSQSFPPKERSGLLTRRNLYTLTVYDTGRFEIPPVEILYSHRDSVGQQRILTPPIAVQVQSVLAGTEDPQLQDIKEPLEIPFDYMFLWSVIGIGAILLIAAWMGYRMWRKKQEQGYVFTPPAPPRPAHEVALQELRALYASDLLEKELYKFFFSRLSEILRTYLEARYFVSALEETTEEIYRDLKKHTEEEPRRRLRLILELADLVKFAKYIPSDKETEEAKDLSVRFVQETKIVYTISEENDTGQEVAAAVAKEN